MSSIRRGVRAFQRVGLGRGGGSSGSTIGASPGGVWTCRRCKCSLLTSTTTTSTTASTAQGQRSSIPSRLLFRRNFTQTSVPRLSSSGPIIGNPSSASQSSEKKPPVSDEKPKGKKKTASGSASGSSPRKRRRLFFTIISGVVVLAALGYSWEDAKHAVGAMRRAGRVAVGLTLCINDYRVTLNQVDAEQDPKKKQHMLDACHKRCANRTYSVLERNGSIFIKLGQHLAAMGYLLPKEWTSTFIPLQDKCPVSSIESIREMVIKDTGHTIEELFDEFDPVPIGAASLAQVHRARLKGTGEEVAVKLQHPSLEEWIPLDIALTRFTFTNIRHFFPNYPLSWLSDEMEASLPNELDFTHEARNIKIVADHFSKLPHSTYPLVVPTVVWAKKRIIVMNYLPGQRLDDQLWLAQHNIDPGDVTAALAHVFNEMIFGTGVPLHCDPHAGNLAIRPSRASPAGFEIILYDHGLYRTIPESLRTSYAKMWLAVLDGDVPALRKYAAEVVGDDAGWSEQRFRIFASAITGREFRVLTKKGGVASEARDDAERAVMAGALTPVNASVPPMTDGIESAGEGENEGGMLAELMQLLSSVPRVVLLILKTNDLTRSLEEMLMRGVQGGSSGERGFLILARYCARRVYSATEFRDEKGRWRWWAWIRAVWALWRVEVRLKVFEVLLRARRAVGAGSGGGRVGLLSA
ncbi:ABC1 family-domain-containing protein [Peziza echinospora]|nr:ABC1 family-domain-containing protein [Peziza echinospora]